MFSLIEAVFWNWVFSGVLFLFLLKYSSKLNIFILWECCNDAPLKCVKIRSNNTGVVHRDFFSEKTFTFREDLSHSQVTRGQPDDWGFVQLWRDGRRKRKKFSEFEKFGVFFLATIACSILAFVFHSKLKCFKLKVKKPQKIASIKNDKIRSF